VSDKVENLNYGERGEELVKIWKYLGKRRGMEEKGKY